MIDIKALAQSNAAVLREVLPSMIENATAPLRERVAALEASIANTKGLQYRGTFAVGTAYDVGDTVTHGGSLWHCNQSTKDRPGEGSHAWTLAVKRGRDGKDAIR
jgi:hypothetical protein